MQNSKYLIAFFSITAMFDQECPMVSYVHAAQRNAVRAKLEQHSTVLQCALPKQEVTDIFPHVPSFPAGFTGRNSSSIWGRLAPKRA